MTRKFTIILPCALTIPISVILYLLVIGKRKKNILNTSLYLLLFFYSAVIIIERVTKRVPATAAEKAGCSAMPALPEEALELVRAVKDTGSLTFA